MAAVQRSRLRGNNTSSSATSVHTKRQLGTSPTIHANGGGHGAGAAAPLAVFLTNLRLLELDLLPDWPGITMETFASTTSAGALQGQRRRIQCVEWALVRLFELWDPQEAASVSLRSAILRALDTAKKNGILGRDSVIRKTMLDDCKGERLEEVLAYFSTAVLKKVAQEDLKARGAHPPISVSLACENRGYSSDDSDLKALILAHKASLGRALERRDEARARYRDFGDLVSVKERGVRRRAEAIRAAVEADCRRDALSNNAREEMRRLVRNNWSGNENWMETLVQGDSHAQGAGLLEMPFDRVWRRVEQGRLAEIEDSAGGLLEQLESRVRMQNERLARWDTFRRDTFGQPAQASASPLRKRPQQNRPVQGIDFRFSEHQHCQVGNAADLRASNTSEGPRIVPKHKEVLDGLQAELAKIKRAGVTVSDFARKGTSTDHEASPGSVSPGLPGDGGEMSDLDDQAYEPEPIPVRTNRTRLQSLTRHAVEPQITALSEIFSHSASTRSSPSPRQDRRNSTRAHDVYIRPLEDDDDQDIEPPPSPTQNMANEILDSMDQQSPSPIKRTQPRPTLSLAQRTRLSMAGSHSPFLDEEPEPELPLGPAAPCDSAKGGPAPVSPSAEPEPLDLASRTRLSMAGFEQAQKKAQLERRRSLRRPRALPRKEGSCFPAVAEESVRDHAKLAEELMLEEDMEAVFKSRPRIKASPVGSPEW
ncbi:hypothetical protein UVI_02056400 [Ustilaginoidea virens]|uniref:HAUS augmin-like complex subunit 6 N-terminal domain-containing protein n=1 Tax=Ustilaginoidea virens TaxID=1159556 RepID=A0A1B5L397_USTVR|nr:hypothetical protein UVI_02056400 [Ustilaginoidea virens]